MKMMKQAKTALTTLFLGAALGSASIAQATDLNLVFLANEEDQEYDAAQVFKNYVESRTGGEVNVNIFVGAQLCGSANECFEAMQAGIVDLFTATAGGVAAIYPPIQGLDIPYAFPDDRTAMTMLTDPEFTGFLRDELLEASNDSIRLMAMTQTGGWRNIVNGEREVRTPADAEGLRFRTIESQIQQIMVREMNASPTPLPWLEVYTGLQTGVVDGTLNSISDITNMNFQEVIKYMTLDNHAYMSSMWLMGNQKFQSLTPEQQRVVADGAAMMSVIQFGIQPRKELEAYRIWREAGGELYTPTNEEMEEFRAIAEPVRDWYLENFEEEGERFIEEFENARDRAQQRVDADRESVMR
ncbi:TRAP transporter substrate-binding protein [Halomonas sp. TD01]|uniref:TRAP transporter substrate-binding protein n=2 Tax=Halomonas sp. TD01 TaxID=999141 RepID=UPI000214D657|nr:TRAP transporter substrate-binding protein DctP [Halomonas sp. TD01]EGP18244.1 TRAP dicarboxylate transporter subunit DctP [Halomonas sp. TD01]